MSLTSYTAQTWVDGGAPPLSAANLQTMENAVQTLARITGRTPQTFSGLYLRSHPDTDKATTKIALLLGKAITMDDGETILNWPLLTADKTASGAGGLDTGAWANSTWYEIHAIRKKSDGTQNLMFHLARSYTKLASNDSPAAGASAQGIGESATFTRLGQSFSGGSGGTLEYVDILSKTAVTADPADYTYLTLEADVSGAPSGTPLATSDAIYTDACPTPGTGTGFPWIRFRFSSRPTLTGTTYWIVGRRTGATSAHSWGWQYQAAAGSGGAQYNGSAWSTHNQFHYRVWTTASTAVVMPSGYDQKCLIGWVLSDSGGLLVPFITLERTTRMLAPFSTAMPTSAASVQGGTIDLSGVAPPIIGSIDIWQDGSSVTANSVTKYASGPAGPGRAAAPNVQGGAAVGAEEFSWPESGTNSAGGIHYVGRIVLMYQMLYWVCCDSAQTGLKIYYNAWSWEAPL